MRALKIVLWLTGVMFLLGVVGLFLPMSAIKSLAGAFGEKAFPDSPVFVYVVRAMCGGCVGIGAAFVVMALRPLAYGALVPLSAISLLFVGVVCAVVGSIEGIPIRWLLGDCLSCIVLGVLILVFWTNARKAAPATEAPESSDSPGETGAAV